MLRHELARIARGLLAGAFLLAMAAAAQADDANKTLKIGVIYDQTGPFAGGGSELHDLGAKIIIDYDHREGRRRGLQDRGDLRRRARASPTSPSTRPSA